MPGLAQLRLLTAEHRFGYGLLPEAVGGCGAATKCNHRHCNQIRKILFTVNPQFLLEQTFNFWGVKQSTAFGLSLVPSPAIIEAQTVKRRIATIAAALQTVGGRNFSRLHSVRHRLNPDKSPVMLCINARKISAACMGDFNEFISCCGPGRRFGLDGVVGFGGIRLQLQRNVRQGKNCQFRSGRKGPHEIGDGRRRYAGSASAA
ncbi:hypothetical protein HFO45_04495 [Rhizobium leguminosarum]|nr:hypothetical protein [Rhizobium leguminosarum]